MTARAVDERSAAPIDANGGRELAAGGDAASAGKFDPAPLLAAIDNYRGSFLDLDAGITVEPASLARVRSALLQRLLASGVQAGERVVVAIGNGPQFVAVLDAVVRCGAQPLLVHSLLPAAELQRTAAKYAARHLLLDAGDAAESLASIGRCATHDSDWFRCLHVTRTAGDESLPAGPGATAWSSWPGVPLHPTSGSTSEPKIAVRPGPCAVAEAVNYLSAAQADRSDALLTVTPMSHAYAYGMGLLVPLLSHARLASLRRFAVKPVLAALEHEGISIFPAAPAMLDMLLFGRGAELLARPRLVLSAGSPLARRTVAAFQRITGRRIHPLYGTTETGGITLGMRGVTEDDFQSVGPPLSGVEVKIVPGESAIGSDVGRVAIRSTSMMAGYLGPTGIDASPLDRGWFLTGDVGRLVDGELYLLGRESDVINVGGLKVVPSEVEEVIAAFPGVVECKVYAGGLERKTQFVKVAIVADGPLDLTRLRSYCAQQLVYYKQPAAYVQLERLPRSPAGKVLKNQLP